MELNQNLTPEQQAALIQNLAKNADPVESAPVYQSSVMNSAPINTGGISLRDKIQAAEKEYYSDPMISHQPMKPKTSYLDEYGNETYYVRNLAKGHVLLDKPEIKIEKGTVTNLLEFASAEDLQKCSDLKKAIMLKTLERIVPEEYLEEMTRALEMRKKTDAMHRQERIKEMQEKGIKGIGDFKVSPSILSKLERLRLSTEKDPEVAKFGWKSFEFIAWMTSESLNEGELNYILNDQTVNKFSDIKAAAIQKKMYANIA